LPLTARTERVHPRALIRVVMMTVVLLSCLPVHGLWRLFGLSSPWPRAFLKGASRAAGLRIDITGIHQDRDILYIANHLSWMDILVLGASTGSAFVAKADMAPWPVIGWMATLHNTVYVAREDRLNVAAQAAAMQAALKTGQPLTLFPEGTTGDGLTLLPFHSSLLAAVAPPPPGIAIQPIAIDYGPNAPEIAWTDAESVGVNALRIMGRKGRLPVTLHFLSPLDSGDFADRKAITGHSREAIAGRLCL
jgi:lyso-ornithine lipid O-acyltransferase